MVVNGRSFVRTTALFVILFAGAVGTASSQSPGGSRAHRIVYENTVDGAFVAGLGPEWSFTGSASTFHRGAPNTDNAPNGRRFIGQFSNDTATLSLSSLPAHSTVTVTFDLLLINSWDGDDGASEQWGLEADGRWLTRTTFSNSPYAGHRQSYPALFGPNGSQYPAYTGANGSGAAVLGFSGWDSVYHLQFTFPHSADALALNFAGIGLTPGYADESWALDDIVVEVGDEPVTVAGWGANTFGQIGPGAAGTQAQRIVTGTERIVGLAAGRAHTLALTSDGAVWGWGRNDAGQLGTGLGGSVPQQIVSSGRFVEVAAGFAHSLALDSDGVVWAWGRNDRGQLGPDPGSDRRRVPVPGAIRISAYGDVNAALTRAGTVWVWGSGGDAGALPSRVPRLVEGLTHVAAITCGKFHGLALRDDGTVWGWGSNESGQLGPGATVPSGRPIDGLANIVAIAAAGSFSLALDRDGHVWQWGTGAGLVSGSFNDAALPRMLPAMDVVRVAAGQMHALALTSDGHVLGWGTNSEGQIGTGDSGDPADAIVPRPIDGLTGASYVAAGESHSLAIFGRPFATVTPDPVMRTYGSPSPPVVATVRSDARFSAAATGTLTCKPWTGADAGLYPLPCDGLASPDHDVIFIDGSLTIVPARLEVHADNKSRPLGEENPPLTASLVGLVNGDEPSGFEITPFASANSTSPVGAYTISVRGRSNQFRNYFTTFFDGILFVTPGQGSTTEARTVYRDGFQDGRVGVGAAWSNPRIATTPSGRIFLGEFGHQTTSLSLTQLPPHVAVTISFDLYILRSWDGYGNACCGEEWQLDMSGGGPALIRTRFSNTEGVGNLQSYPDWTGKGTHHQRTGAIEQDTLGYSPWGDAVYHMEFTVPHSDDNVAFNFTGINLQDTADESWGLDNVRVEVSSSALFGWGLNDKGQLGGNALDVARPVVARTGDFLSVVAGSQHSLALKADGTVWGFGENREGQLADIDGGEIPQQLTAISDVASISAGPWYSLFVKRDGTVWRVGRGDGGGVDDPLRNPTPRHIDGLTDIVATSAGSTFALALRSDGTVWGWGSNLFGEIGADALGASYVPVHRIPGLERIVAIAAGSEPYAVAVDYAGNVWGWGINDAGQLGAGAGGGVRRVIDATKSIVGVAAAEQHTLALSAAGTLWGLGANFAGQLAASSPENVTDPRLVTTGVAAFAAAKRHSLIARQDGSLWGWGDNFNGQNGSEPGSATPQKLESSWGTNSVRDITSVATSEGHTLAVASVARLSTVPGSNPIATELRDNIRKLLIVHVVNTGRAPVTIQEVRLREQAPSSFFSKELDWCSSVSLAPNAECEVHVLFAPETVGFRLAELVIVDADGHGTRAVLTGNALRSFPSMSVGRVTQAFGGTARLSASLARPASDVPGKLITFTLSGKVVGTAITDATGTATLENVSLAGIDAGTYIIGASFAGDAEYFPSDNIAELVITKARPEVTWIPETTAIVYGTPLTGAQLNASASVAGTFAYLPAAGTMLHAGRGQDLSVTFTPADPRNYEAVAMSRSIEVTPSPLLLRVNDATKVFGAPLPPFSVAGTGFVDGDSLGSLGGTLVFSTSAVVSSAPGIYTVSASGVASSDYTIALAPGTLTVVRATTATRFTSSSNPGSFGQAVTFTATLAPVRPGAGLPQGTVDFFDGAILLANVALNNGVGSLNVALSPGLHDLSARYAGDANFEGSSGTLTQTINSAAGSSSTTLQGAPSPSLASAPVTLNATVAPLTGSSIPTGTVTFYDNLAAAPLGSSTLRLVKGRYEASIVTALPAIPGTHTLVARYSGDGSLGPSMSAPVAHTVYTGTVPRETTTTLTGPIAVSAGAAFTAAAQVAVAKGKKASVAGAIRLHVDGVALPAGVLDGSGAAAFTVPALPVGIHTLVAEFLGDAAQQFGGSTSAPAVVIVR